MQSLQPIRSVLWTLAALAGAVAARADAPPAPVTVSYGSLVFTPCTLSQAGQAQTVPARCATLRVPEDRSSANSRSVSRSRYRGMASPSAATNDLSTSRPRCSSTSDSTMVSKAPSANGSGPFRSTAWSR